MTLQDKSEVLHCLQNLGNEWTFCDMVSFNRKHMIPGFMNSFFLLPVQSMFKIKD